ncbi:MAG: CRISPR-associated endonuclease Cas2 [bacterium]
MICWVMYDIKNDKTRGKISKHCIQAGLNRVQYSVFLGKMEPNQKDTLTLQCQQLFNSETDSIYIFPMSKDELKDTVLLGQAFDKKMITHEVRALFI